MFDCEGLLCLIVKLTTVNLETTRGDIQTYVSDEQKCTVLNFVTRMILLAYEI